jgi:hypothetical protein
MDSRHRINTLYIEPGSPWENGFCKNFNSKLNDEVLNGEVFFSLKEVRVLAGRWRVRYNTIRPHCSLDYLPPVPETWQYELKREDGELESKVRSLLSYTFEGCEISKISLRYAHKSAGTKDRAEQYLLRGDLRSFEDALAI